jgi:excisionase family DNA binding protein
MKRKVDPDQWISQAEAAKLRGVSRQAIARLVQKGRFETLSIGGKTLLMRSEVEEYQPKPPGPSPKDKRKRRK